MPTVSEVLSEISCYRGHITHARRLILEYEDETADARDRMRYMELSKRDRLEYKRDLKELRDEIKFCRSHLGRYERWVKRLRRGLPSD